MTRRAPASLRDRDDAALVDQARSGDHAAFAVLVERHRPTVLRVAANVAGPDAAEDVAQEAFLRSYHRLSRFRAEASFRAWLLQITYNAALDSVRRGRSAPAGPVSEDALAETPADTHRSPASRLLQGERNQRLRFKIAQLAPDRRAALVLRDIEELSYADMARITESSTNTIKGRLHRARKDLATLLRENTYDWELPDE